MERQLKQVHERVIQQRESICHLKAENLEMQRLQVSSCGHCTLDYCARPGQPCGMSSVTFKNVLVILDRATVLSRRVRLFV